MRTASMVASQISPCTSTWASRSSFVRASGRCRRCGFEEGKHLDVVRVRVEIVWPREREAVTGFDEPRHVARPRRGVARHVQDAAGRACDEQVGDVFAEPGARWVDGDEIGGQETLR